jgi:hypothetical protein
MMAPPAEMSTPDRTRTATSIACVAAPGAGRGGVDAGEGQDRGVERVKVVARSSSGRVDARERQRRRVDW